MTDQVALVALSLLPSNLWRVAADQLRAGGRPAAVLGNLVQARPDGPPLEALVARAAEGVSAGARLGLLAIPFGSEHYPSALASIVDPPFVLWLRGRPEWLAGPAVAIVGSRAASPHGLSVAERLGRDLAARGLVVISGLARGVDGAAHQGALAGGGATIGVLGSGADVIYPAEHRSLAATMAEQGAVVSELVPGTLPLPQFFPLRNRIISGLSRGVLVVEAGERSGSLITARLALEQGRDVLAVPGNVLSGRNRGAHALLRDGARLVETADDVLEELGLGPATGGSVQADEAGGDSVLANLPLGEPVDLDALGERTGLDPSALFARVCALELDGRVRRAGGGRFVRI